MTSEWFLFTLLKIYTSPKTNFWLRPCVSFPKYYLQRLVANKSWQQAGNFPVYGEVTGKSV